MKTLNTTIGVTLVTAISLIGTAVVAATGHDVSSSWWTLNTVLVGATAGVSVPAASSSSPSPTPTEPPGSPTPPQ